MPGYGFTKDAKSDTLRTLILDRASGVENSPKALLNVLPSVLAAAAVVVVGMLLLMLLDNSGARDAAAPAPTFVAQDGTLEIAAVGYVDPADFRHAGDASRLQVALRSDAHQQLIEKAVGLFLSTDTLARHYAVVALQVLADHRSFIRQVSEEPSVQGSDGLLSLTARAQVDVLAVQKALQYALREQRVFFVRQIPDAAHSANLADTTARVPVAHRVVVRVLGLPAHIDESLQREFTSLRPVLSISLAQTGGDPHYTVELAGDSEDPIELVAIGLLAPLHQKLGKACFGITRRQAQEVTLSFDASCNAPEILARLDQLPVAGLMLAPAMRRDSVITDPEKIRRLGL